MRCSFRLLWQSDELHEGLMTHAALTLLLLACNPRSPQLIDSGRAHYLRRLGFDAQLVQHVSHSLTADNVMILATRTPSLHADVVST